MERKGFFARLKEGLKRYLEKMGEDNQKMFGNRRLDCCTMNKRFPVTKKSNISVSSKR